MNHNFDFETFEDYCKHLAKRLACDWKELASDPMVVNQALTAFCNLADNGHPAPPWLMKFIASGVKEYLRHGAALWPVKTGRPPSPPIIAAMVQFIDERFPRKKGKIASHLNKSLDWVGDRAKEASAEITRLLSVFRARDELNEADFKSLLLELDKVIEAAERMRPVIKRVQEDLIALALSGKAPD